jgi:hypothetical protein
MYVVSQALSVETTCRPLYSKHGVMGVREFSESDIQNKIMSRKCIKAKIRFVFMYETLATESWFYNHCASCGENSTARA